MIAGRRVVVVCPAGRRRYSALLAAHLEAQRPGVDACHWWLNTDDPADLAFHRALAAADPSFHVAVAPPIGVAPRAGANHGEYHHSIHPFYAGCIDPETIYVRCDDDVVWLAPDALDQLVRYRLAHPRPFMVSANVVNHSICAHLHQRFGAFAPPRPIHYATRGGHGDPANLVHQPDLAEFLHRAFLESIAAGRLDRWRFGRWVLWEYPYIQVNCICWSGADMAALAPDYVTYPEEHQLAVILPHRLGRPNEICGRALVAHFAYNWQRAHMDATDLLARYAVLAPESKVVNSIGR